jgi:hypothetical protein
VTEVKSGPAFNKSAQVLRWQQSCGAMRSKQRIMQRDMVFLNGMSDAAQLINDPSINAVYVATPPGSHEEYAIAALLAGKPGICRKTYVGRYRFLFTYDGGCRIHNIQNLTVSRITGEHCQCSIK